MTIALCLLGTWYAVLIASEVILNGMILFRGGGEMRIPLVASLVIVGLSAMEAPAQYCYDSQVLWELQRQSNALENIAWSLEQDRRDRRAAEMARQYAEIARLRAVQDARDRLAFNERFDTVQDEANAAVDGCHVHKARGTKETREERVARRLKWNQYKRMRRYSWARWGD